ncbi:hypothetical protein FHY16_003291 [Xanthomonas campestris]|uniref:hypothetical protein n=1 Tax=Xanthomonas euroxanthea TaxID=2259622 RepID=UPI0017A0C724|nr:hypothetical protein [Xanthomonas euroxanthea]MBB3780501.1 hypothetical protein [Xanthomonas euroxanthea]
MRRRVLLAEQQHPQPQRLPPSMRAWMQTVPSMPASESVLLLLQMLLLLLLLLLMQMQMPTPFQSQHPKLPEPPPSTRQSFASPCTLPGW